MHVPNSFYGRVSNVHAKKTLPKIKEGQQQHVSVEMLAMYSERERQRRRAKQIGQLYTHENCKSDIIWQSCWLEIKSRKGVLRAAERHKRDAKTTTNTSLSARGETYPHAALAFDWGHFCSPHTTYSAAAWRAIEIIEHKLVDKYK
jgi:hypothetical protein